MTFLCKAKLPESDVREIVRACAGGSDVVTREQFCASMHRTYAAIGG